MKIILTDQIPSGKNQVGINARTGRRYAKEVA